MALWLRVVEGVVAEAAWAANGCPAMIASASAVAELSENQSTSKLVTLDAGAVHDLIGQLPEGKEYATEMALELVCRALTEENEHV